MKFGTHLPLLLLDRLHLSGLIDSFDFKIAMLTPYIKIHIKYTLDRLHLLQVKWTWTEQLRLKCTKTTLTISDTYDILSHIVSICIMISSWSILHCPSCHHLSCRVKPLQPPPPTMAGAKAVEPPLIDLGAFLLMIMASNIFKDCRNRSTKIHIVPLPLQSPSFSLSWQLPIVRWTCGAAAAASRLGTPWYFPWYFPWSIINFP